ncbi:MAG TPA: hypothetical protein PK264_02120 [Hyphomicrobiaceae bacterium]|nr:hypothetical protein [Hyphomicrobiaceae bacterium]
MTTASAVTMVRPASEGPVRFTFGTLMTSPEQHAALLATLDAHGFGADDCEVLVVDNARGALRDAYRGLNEMLNAARGDIIILCHQDVRLLKDGREELEARLADLEAKAPDWGVAGNAGGISPGRLALRITDPHGADLQVGAFPARVQSLDENFLIVRRAARLSFSRDLTGYHMYGSDICLVADVLGWSCWVIDFHIEHLSGGRKDESFHAAEREFNAKWRRAFRPRLLQTTCTLVSIAGDPVLGFFGRMGVGPIGKISRRLPGAQGFGARRDGQ